MTTTPDPGVTTPPTDEQCDVLEYEPDTTPSPHLLALAAAQAVDDAADDFYLRPVGETYDRDEVVHWLLQRGQQMRTRAHNEASK